MFAIITKDVIILKRILLILLLITSMCILPKDVNAADTITVYLFRGDTCQHCEEALEYLDNHRDIIPDNVELVTYEVYRNDANATLMDTVADTLEVDKTKNYGTPFFVVGNEYVKGYGTGTWEELFDMAENYASNGEYEDIVAKTISDKNMDVEAITFEDLYSEPNPVVTIIVYSVFGIIVLGFIAMIVFSRR